MAKIITKLMVSDNSRKAKSQIRRYSQIFVLPVIAAVIFIMAQLTPSTALPFWHSSDAVALEESANDSNEEDTAPDSFEGEVYEEDSLNENTENNETSPQTTRLFQVRDEESTIRDPFAAPLFYEPLPEPAPDPLLDSEPEPVMDPDMNDDETVGDLPITNGASKDVIMSK